MKFSTEYEICKLSQNLYCKVVLNIDDLTIGDVHAWTFGGTLFGAISDLIKNTKNQKPCQEIIGYFNSHSIQDVFNFMKNFQSDEMMDWQIKIIEGLNLNYEEFLGLPFGVELLDGEYAYILKFNEINGVFIWRDFDSKLIHSKIINIEKYLNEWFCINSDILKMNNKLENF